MASTRQIQSPVLVGRDDVLQTIGRTVETAQARRGQTLLIAGEAGIGKSRIVATLLRQAQKAGFRIATGAIAPQDQLVSFASLHDLARDLQPAAFGTLGADLLAVQRAEEAGDSLAARRMLVREIAERITGAIDKPTAFVFEDIHWADELTLEVIGELARHGTSLPLLVVATYRPEELPRGSIHREWRSRLLTQRVAHEVTLERLGAEATAQMTTLILATGLPAPRDVAEAVYERTNGIPLHVEELIAALGDHASEGRAIRSATVPSTIHDAVLARLSRLSPDAQAAARAGAVMGRSFLPDALAGVMGVVPAELDAPLDELVAAGILTPFQAVDHGYFDFRHQLLRDAIYASVATADLRRFHARAAEFGAQLAGATDVHKSVHYERAGLRVQAFSTALAGAEAAAAVTSRFESFELYRRAVANLPDDLSASEAADVWMAYCYAGFSIDDVPAAEEAATQARRLYLEAGRPADAAFALASLGALARRDVRPRSERKEKLDAAASELEALPMSPDQAMARIDLLTMQALLAGDAADLPETRRRMAQATELAHTTGIEETHGKITRLDIEHQLAWADVIAGDAETGLPRMLSLSREARDAHFESTGVTSYRITADVAARVMEYQVAEVAVGEGIKFADEIEQSYCRHILSATSALLAWASGRWDAAVSVAELELVQRGSRRGSIGSRAALAFVAFGRGDTERARSLLDASLAITRPSGEIELILPALWGQAETALVDGDPTRALDHCWEAVELVEPTGERALLVPFVVTGVRAAIHQRRPEVAQKWLDRVIPMLAAWPDLTRPAIDHAEGLIRTATGSTVSARNALESAVSGWDVRGRTWEATWARLDLAAALSRGNRHAEAVPILTEVLATARRLGSLPLLRRAEELERSARSRAGDQEPWSPLSMREYEVARKIAEGLTNAAIAEELFVSPKTVSAHVEHILAKLGVARRTEVAAWVATVSRPVSAAR